MGSTQKLYSTTTQTIINTKAAGLMISGMLLIYFEICALVLPLIGWNRHRHERVDLSLSNEFFSIGFR